MKATHFRKQFGSSLVVVMSVLATLMVVVGVAVEYTTTINRHVQRSNTQANAVAVADSCIDILFSNWRAICAAPPNQTMPLPTSPWFTSIPLPTSSQFPSIPGFAATTTDYYGNNTANPPTVSNYKVVAANAEWQPLASSAATPIPMLGQIAATLLSITPTTSLVYNYIASADVTLPTLGTAGNRTVVAKVRRVFQKQQLSPWNFAIFYVDPLEIHPGPQFTVTGWVHTNSDLYTGHDTLTFADKVTYASDWFVGFKPGETYHSGDTPAAPHYATGLPPARDQSMQPFGLDATSIFSTTDSNPNNDSYHELIEQATAGYTDPLAGQRYYDQAAIKILIDASNNLTIQRADGKTVKPAGCSSSYACGTNDVKLYNAIVNAVDTNQTIQDNREGETVRLATLDIGAIVTSLGSSGPSSQRIDSTMWNGIIYITDTSATNNAPNPPATPPPSPVHRGIRLKNGEVLPANGITVASANPVYIQGDYNTGNGTVPSNSTTNNDPTIPQSSGYTRQPASVVADAVTILSNNWNDSNAGVGKPLSGRQATNTTVNTAIIAGIVSSSPVGGDGNYSGGAENFPRFLESWDKVKFTYYGSMLELYQSKQAVGEWTMSNVYDAPDRQWYFDTNFKTKPPPGSLMLYSYIKGKWSVL
jgi:hypothetical protein